MYYNKHYTLSINKINLVFCLDWFALISHDGLKEIKKIANSYKASHLCLNPNDSASAALAFINKKNTYSAAQIFAQMHANETVAMVVQLDTNKWWLVASQKGSVIVSSDKIFESKDLIQKQVLDLQTTYTNLKVIYINDQPQQLEKIALNANEGAVLKPTNIKFKQVFKLALAMFFLLVFGFIIIKSVYGFGIKEQKALGVLETEQLWDLALKNATASHNLHDEKAVLKVLKNIYEIPVAIQGWLLSDAQCSHINQYWQCSANYYRNHSLANNKNLLASIPNHWDLAFSPLDRASASWKLDNQAVNILNAELNSSKHHETFLFSDLQAIKPALPSVNIQNAKAINVVSPMDDKGQLLPKPKDFPVFYSREFQIKAPLRSLSLLLKHHHGIAWKKIALVMQANVKPNLTSSAISVTIDGVLYEKN